jgi:phosphate transport system permease protein
MSRDDLLVLGAAAAAAASLVWILFGLILPVQGIGPAATLWFGTFLVIYRFAVASIEGRLAAQDKMMAALIALAGLTVVVALSSILLFILLEGIRYLRLSFFFNTMESIGPQDPPTTNGGLHAIVGTVVQVALATAVSVPLGILTAVFLNEIRGGFSRPVRMFVNAMSGVPSIVAGLFIYAILILRLGWEFSGLAAALALSILMLPTVTRTAEEVLRLVPGGLREASLALGAPEWRSVTKVVLPTARIGIVTAVILGIARVIGETAPLFMTSFGSDVMNADPFSGPQSSLPQYIFKQIKQLAQENSVPRGYVGALVLLTMVIVLFATARFLGRPRVDKTRRRRRRSRRARAVPPVEPSNTTTSKSRRRWPGGPHIGAHAKGSNK